MLYRLSTTFDLLPTAYLMSASLFLHTFWAQILPPRRLLALLLEVLFDAHDGSFALFLHLLWRNISRVISGHEAAPIALHELDRLALFGQLVHELFHEVVCHL